MQRLIAQGGSALRLVPCTLKEALECEVWGDRLTPNKAVVSNASFREWVTAPYPHGIGATEDLVRELCQRDPAMQITLDRALQQSAGNQRIAEQPRDDRGRVGAKAPDRTVNNVHETAEERPAGNSSQAGIRRIRKAAEAGDLDAAAMLRLVEAKEMSVHAAMIGLGWRQTTLTLPDEPAAIVRAAVPALARQGSLL